MKLIRCEETGKTWEEAHPKFPYMVGERVRYPERYTLIEDIDTSEEAQCPTYYEPIETPECPICPMPGTED